VSRSNDTWSFHAALWLNVGAGEPHGHLGQGGTGQLTDAMLYVLPRPLGSVYDCAAHPPHDRGVSVHLGE